MLKWPTCRQIMTYKSLILSGAALILSSTSIQNAAAQCRAITSDTSYASLNDPGYTREFQGDGVPAYFRVTRVVGPGTTSEFNAAPSTSTNPNGTLVNWSTYVQNGIVSSQANLQVFGFMSVDNQFWSFATLAGLIPAADLEVTFTLNGVKIGHPYVLRVLMNAASPPVTSTPFSECIPVPVNLIRFAQKTAGQPCPTYSHYDPPPHGNDTTCAGLNEVEPHFRFRMSPPQSNVDPSAALAALPFLDLGHSPAVVQAAFNSINTFVRGLTLSFDAMAPIVLVHGWNAGPWDWGDPTTGSCPPKPTSNNGKGQLNFVQAFIDAHAPFDCSINLGSQVTWDVGGSSLQSRLPKILSGFGTRHVNLVAHSKGGLYVRKFLQLNITDVDPAQRIGVISATTLDTPHRGSVLATTVAHFNSPPFYSALIKFAQTVGVSVDFLGKGANDMTPKSLADFNQQYETPPSQFNLSDSNGNSFVTQPSYFSTSADADLNTDGKITGVEADPPYSQRFGNFAYQTIARGQPVTTLVIAALRTLSRLPKDTFYFLNDCLVPVYSAQYPGFTEIHSYQGNADPPGLGRNHGTIRKPDVAKLVLQNIVLAESRQP
jgi:hypothetical protein